MYRCTGWTDFEVLDTGEGEKLERWGRYLLRRPDPQVIWPRQDEALWERADACYHRQRAGRGRVVVRPRAARTLDAGLWGFALLCAPDRF